MILAGDIGGTKTILTLYSEHKQKGRTVLQCELEQTFNSTDYPQFNDILSVFLQANMAIDAVCFGIAGPIIEQRCQTTNLPWIIDAQELQKKFGTHKVKLLNDLEAMAIGMLNSLEEDLIELNPHAKNKPGNIAVIAAGTGLGEAILYWDGGEQHHPIPTEGGHADFASQTKQQDQLLNYLRKRFNNHVSWERVLSGDGFGYLYDFLVDTGFAPACIDVPSQNDMRSYADDRNAIISRLGIKQANPICIEVMRLFTELYAAEAGNLALKCLATGGVFIGGGIGPKILPALQSESFVAAFTAKGRFESLLSDLSIKLSLNPKAPLVGAANYFSN